MEISGLSIPIEIIKLITSNIYNSGDISCIRWMITCKLIHKTASEIYKQKAQDTFTIIVRQERERKLMLKFLNDAYHKRSPGNEEYRTKSQVQVWLHDGKSFTYSIRHLAKRLPAIYTSGQRTNSIGSIDIHTTLDEKTYGKGRLIQFEINKYSDLFTIGTALHHIEKGHEIEYRELYKNQGTIMPEWYLIYPIDDEHCPFYISIYNRIKTFFNEIIVKMPCDFSPLHMGFRWGFTELIKNDETELSKKQDQKISIGKMEYLPEEIILQLCQEMDTQSLSKFMQSSKINTDICLEVLEERKRLKAIDDQVSILQSLKFPKRGKGEAQYRGYLKVYPNGIYSFVSIGKWSNTDDIIIKQYIFGNITERNLENVRQEIPWIVPTKTYRERSTDNTWAEDHDYGERTGEYYMNEINTDFQSIPGRFNRYVIIRGARIDPNDKDTIKLLVITLDSLGYHIASSEEWYHYFADDFTIYRQFI